MIPCVNEGNKDMNTLVMCAKARMRMGKRKLRLKAKLVAARRARAKIGFVKGI